MNLLCRPGHITLYFVIVEQNATAGWEGVENIVELNAEAAANIGDHRKSAPVVRVGDCWRVPFRTSAIAWLKSLRLESCVGKIPRNQCPARELSTT
jgi:hypothetical protein